MGLVISLIGLNDVAVVEGLFIEKEKMTVPCLEIVSI